MIDSTLSRINEVWCGLFRAVLCLLAPAFQCQPIQKDGKFPPSRVGSISISCAAVLVYIYAPSMSRRNQIGRMEELGKKNSNIDFTVGTIIPATDLTFLNPGPCESAHLLIRISGHGVE